METSDEKKCPESNKCGHSSGLFLGFLLFLFFSPGLSVSKYAFGILSKCQLFNPLTGKVFNLHKSFISSNCSLSLINYIIS
jgi:hypothetical protein